MKYIIKSNRNKKFGNRLHWIALAFTMAATVGSAQTAQWNSTNSTTDDKWSTGGNWATIPSINPETPSFVQMFGTRTSSDMDADYTVTALQFGGSANLILGSSGDKTLTLLGSAGTIADNTNLIYFASGSTNSRIVNVALEINTGGKIDATQANLSIVGGMHLNSVNGMRFIAGSGKTLNLAGGITGTSSGIVAFNGAGTYEISGNNTFTGDVRIWNGTVNLLSNNALGASLTTVQLGVGSGASIVQVLAGGGVSMARNFEIANTSLSASYEIGANSPGVASFSSINIKTKDITTSAVTGARVDIGIITGSSGGVVKVGAGIVALTHASIPSSYLGSTEIDAGTFLVNGALGSLGDGGGMVTIKNGAKLGGFGVINRAVAFDEGSILSPGDVDTDFISQIGDLTINGDVFMDATTSLQFDLGNVENSDSIHVGGDLSLDGIVNIRAANGFGVGEYVLISFSGTFIDNGLSYGLFDVPSGYTFDIQIDESSKRVILSVGSSIPEPATLSVFVGLGAFLFSVVGSRRMCRKTHA